jgi:hypothetical protein
LIEFVSGMKKMGKHKKDRNEEEKKSEEKMK